MSMPLEPSFWRKPESRSNGYHRGYTTQNRYAVFSFVPLQARYPGREDWILAFAGMTTHHILVYCSRIPKRMRLAHFHPFVGAKPPRTGHENFAGMTVFALCNSISKSIMPRALAEGKRGQEPFSNAMPRAGGEGPGLDRILALFRKKVPDPFFASNQIRS